MKKSLIITLSLIAIALVLISAFIAAENAGLTANKKPFNVGVTYCGDSVTEAEQLIDRVANYTNLFVLQSGPMMDQFNASEQILDYAVNSGLNVIFYYSTNSFGNTRACDALSSLLSVAPTRWSSHFLGLYFNDEPGGHILDGSINFNNYVDLNSNSTSRSVSVDGTGVVSFSLKSGPELNPVFTEITIYPSGEINLSPVPFFGGRPDTGSQDQNTDTTIPVSSIDNPYNCTTYYPNGTITYIAYGALEMYTYESNGSVFNQNGEPVTDGEISADLHPTSKSWI
jgi:hypothetical protein